MSLLSQPGSAKLPDAEILALIEQGFEAFGRGELAAAAQAADRILALEGNQVDALYLKGRIAHQQERLDAAQDFYERAILSRPDFVDPYLKLIALLLTTDRNDSALAAWRYALAHVKPDPALLAELCGPMVENFAAEARETLRPVLAHAGATIGTWTLYQQVLHRLRVDGAEYDELMAGMRARFGSTAEVEAAEAMALSYRDRVDEASQAYQAMRDKYPHLAFFDGELARAYRDSGRLDEAERQVLQLAQVSPSADYDFMLAELRLQCGLIGEGLALYERRFDRPLGFNWKHLPFPNWRGESLAGKKIVVFEEQGLGDSIMFGRYLPALIAQGARVAYVCRPELYALFASQPSLRRAEIHARTRAIPLTGGEDYYVSAVSIAHCLGIDTAAASLRCAYLEADPQRIAHWAKQLPRHGRRRVGIAWAANLATGIGNSKSMPPALVASLLGDPALTAVVDFVSLQVPAALDAPHRHLYAATPEIADFSDTMAVIANLDLVVSVDTSVAHLAASMGKPTIVMSKFAPDWRWAAPAGGPPYWYPQVEVIRQAEPRDWASALQRLTQRLKEPG
ncbi:MAG TPA: glycosyltransferase family 9 protein [Burkholderiales bacterium]|jgi:tetratricopeptide (TPR) repeat protein